MTIRITFKFHFVTWEFVVKCVASVFLLSIFAFWISMRRCREIGEAPWHAFPSQSFTRWWNKWCNPYLAQKMMLIFHVNDELNVYLWNFNHPPFDDCNEVMPSGCMRMNVSTKIWTTVKTLHFYEGFFLWKSISNSILMYSSYGSFALNISVVIVALIWFSFPKVQMGTLLLLLIYEIKYSGNSVKIIDYKI